MDINQLSNQQLIEKVLQLEAKLTERTKELNCISELSILAETKDNSNDILGEFIYILKESWQFPGITEVRITNNGFCYQTEKFKKTAWTMHSDIMVEGIREGEIHIAYQENKTNLADPFLKEEYNLLHIVSKYLGKIIERLQKVKKYAVLFETLFEGIIKADKNGIICEANPEAAKICGYSTADELIGKQMIDLYPNPEMRSKLLEKLEKEEGNLHNYEFLLKRKDHTTIPVLANIRMQYNTKQEIVGTLGAIRDISEMKKVESALRESEKKFRTIFENAPVFINSFDAKGKCILWNKACEKAFGYTKEEIIQQKDPFSLFYPDDEIRNEVLKTVLIEPDEKFREWKPVTKEGKVLSTVWANFRVSDNRIISVGYDITHKKHSEELLTQNNNALNKLNQVAFELTNLPSEENLEEFIVKKVKEISGAEVAIFSEYNSSKKTTTPRYVEMESGVLKKVVNLLGKKVQKIHSVISEEVYQEMTTEMIGQRKTLYDATFGSIPRPVAASIQALLKADRFIGIAYFLDGELYGISLLAMRASQPDPPMQILKNFIHLASASLRRRRSEQALKESEEKYKRLVNNSNSLIVEVNADTFEIVNCNPAMANTFNKDVSELVGKNIKDILPPDILKTRLKYIEKALLENKVQRFEDERNGRYFLNNVIPQIVQNQRFVQTVNYDVTELKQAQQAVRESEEKYRLITENASDVIWILNLTRNAFTYISPSVYALRGYTPEEAVKQDIHQSLTPESANEVTRIIEQVLPEFIKNPEEISNKVYRNELRQTCKDGSIIWIETTTRYQYNSLNEIEVLGISRDINERKKAEQALKENEEKLRLIGDNIPNGQIYQFIVYASGERQFTYVSKKVEELHECTIEEAIAKPELIYNRVLPEDMTGLQAAAEKSIREMCELDHEFRVKRKSGEIRWHRMISKPRKLNNGDILFDGIDFDITSQKEYEMKLQKYSGELEKLNKDKDKFMSILAHDLKSPFNSLVGYSGLLVKNVHKYDSETIKEQVSIINNTARKTYTLLEDILLWTRSQSGEIVYNPGEIKINEACISITEETEPVARAKDIVIKSNISSGISVITDINLVKTVLRNLVLNAIKFTHEGGIITLDAKPAEEKIIVSVTDTGVGISAHGLTEIFNTETNTTTPGTNQEKGSGLGLQICKEFVGKMGGKIWAESQIDKGSTFYFTIPEKPPLNQS